MAIPYGRPVSPVHIPGLKTYRFPVWGVPIPGSTSSGHPRGDASYQQGGSVRGLWSPNVLKKTKMVHELHGTGNAFAGLRYPIAAVRACPRTRPLPAVGPGI